VGIALSSSAVGRHDASAKTAVKPNNIQVTIRFRPIISHPYSGAQVADYAINEP
jgi:hypothetical protein